jgi:hypothetical protein
MLRVRPSKIMKLRNFVSSALMAVALASPIFAADSTTESDDQYHRDYLELKRKELEADQKDREADQKDRLFHHVLLVIYGTAVVAFLVFYFKTYRGFVRRSFELAKGQQKTLEEIRDLLRKQ